jgi:hypothetical protein
MKMPKLDLRNGLMGIMVSSLARSEWFYGDCEVKDEKIRKDLVYNWVRSAYLSGYEMGRAIDELAHKTPQGTPDAL